MKDLEQVLRGFYEATGCAVAVWARRGPDANTLIALARSAPRLAAPENFPATSSSEEVLSNGGTIVVISVPGTPRTWLAVGPWESHSIESIQTHLRTVLPFVVHVLRGAREVEHSAIELAERYEEINLLYTIGEILGRTVTLEEAATTILTEISETVGARRSSILVHDPSSASLQVVAAIGISPKDATPILVDDPGCVSARVFRTQHPMTVEPGEMECSAELPYRRGEMLSVPIMWTTPAGGEPLGVVNLSDRRSRQPFSAGDQKLVAAIATQIGTAIQNARLVRASIEQQRLAQEMRLAHDLQMKLLPNPAFVSPEADVAARVVPAESVGGDFYHLFRMPGGRTGVMIGDVSGHGYGAALIMALTMSASAIHAQNAADPGQMLAMLYGSLKDELSTTEMFISVFFGVLEKGGSVFRYANTGHPHAFIFPADGEPRRLPADQPPLGMSEDTPVAAMANWKADSDLLVLFTDGIPDSRNAAGERLGEAPVLRVISQHRSRPVSEIVEHVFELLRNYAGEVPSPDDLTLLVLRS